MTRNDAVAVGDPGGSPPNRGRPTGDHAARRAELLAAARQVIAEVGLANASLRKVAQAAGCTTGTVTYYFAGKDELVWAISESGFDWYDEMLESIRETADLRSLTEQWLHATTADPDYWQVMLQLLAHAQHEPALAAVIADRYARYRKIYAEILAGAQRSGKVRDDIPADLLADQLAAMGDGWTMLFRIEPQRFTPARLKKLVDAMITLVEPQPRS